MFTLSHSSSLIPHSFTSPINIKLNEDNYLIWKQQILAIIRSLKLMLFLEGINVPPHFQPNTDPQDNTFNTKYLQYEEQDQNIVAWLLSSMTIPILKKMVGLKTTSQIWYRSSTHFASHTREKIKKLKAQLKASKKDRSVHRYLLDIKNIVDTLAAVRAPISTKDHIEIILDGLLEEYD